MSGYFDYNATAPLRPEAAEAMASAARELVGNASSMHAGGRAARAAIDEAREAVAALAGVAPSEVFFTSGATEANNLALRGALAADPERRLLFSAIEHASVRNTAEALAAEGRSAKKVAVSSEGVPMLADHAADLADEDHVLSIGRACGETGRTLDIDGLLAALPERHILHVDATQAMGRLADSIPARADLASFSGHKIGGPPGAGVLVVRSRVRARIAPILFGGPQEDGLRAGTENTPALVGLGAAAAVVQRRWRQEIDHIRLLRDLVQFELLARVPRLELLTPEDGLANTLSVAVREVDADTLVAGLDLAGYAISTGSACAAASPEPSAILQALGIEDGLRSSTVRISLGWASDEADIPGFLDAFETVVRRARRSGRGAAA